MDLEYSHTVAKLVARAAQDKQADSIIAIDIHEHTPFTDIIVVISADSDRKVRAIYQEVEEQLLVAGHKVLRREGQEDNRWVVLDYGSVMVHVFIEQMRDFYALEKLWKDCPQQDLTH